MSEDAFRHFVKLPEGASPQEVAKIVGKQSYKSQGKANGLARGWTLLAFKDLKLEISFWQERLITVQLDFEPMLPADNWPDCIAVPRELSGEMNEQELVDWLNQQPYQWTRVMLPDGNPQYRMADSQATFLVVDGFLHTMHLTCPVVNTPIQKAVP